MAPILKEYKEYKDNPKDNLKDKSTMVGMAREEFISRWTKMKKQ